MRLPEPLLVTIKQVLSDAVDVESLWLFGSRVDDNKRGGDIDLYLEPKQRLSYPDMIRLESRLNNSCGEKVDLLVKNPDEPMTTIQKIALETGVRLI
ncbi:nucleotidyltransferase domain-containing protein [Ectothiorhodospiraceae bacterium BW-2]|nr:nucleotidyltransferase domain-containing protein [Ectothiorhodospiraceae bacterium BW-2]